jgi:hypothetical protein
MIQCGCQSTQQAASIALHPSKHSFIHARVAFCYRCLSYAIVTWPSAELQSYVEPIKTLILRLNKFSDELISLVVQVMHAPRISDFEMLGLVQRQRSFIYQLASPPFVCAIRLNRKFNLIMQHEVERSRVVFDCGTLSLA